MQLSLCFCHIYTLCQNS